jgi:ABC-type polysaccharide/polyol phosphate transport system ATPase subunit
LFFWRRKDYYKDFWAVKDISLEIEKGEIVGLIGANGAGKSTLLKMIAGLLDVDKGTIKITGKVTALLALGLGFHPEFTGRENIVYGGMLLGMSKKEVLGKMEDIIDFAEIGEYIDRPFRTYSAGMKARLIFATSMSIDPDILLIDEALATGDTYFVQKCSKRIEKICNSGATIIYVSHNLWHIQQLCKKVILIDQGEILAEGDPSVVVSKYHALIFEKGKKDPLVMNHQPLKMISGTGEVIVTDIKIKGENGRETTGFHTGDEMNIEIYYRSFKDTLREINVLVGFIICKSFSYVGEINTMEYFEKIGLKPKSESVKIGREGVIFVKVNPLLLLNDHYSLWVILYENGIGHTYYSEYKNVNPFFVAKSTNPSVKGGAICWVPASFTVGEKTSKDQ